LLFKIPNTISPKSIRKSPRINMYLVFYLNTSFWVFDPTLQNSDTRMVHDCVQLVGYRYVALKQITVIAVSGANVCSSYRVLVQKTYFWEWQYFHVVKIIFKRRVMMSVFWRGYTPKITHHLVVKDDACVAWTDVIQQVNIVVVLSKATSCGSHDCVTLQFPLEFYIGLVISVIEYVFNTWYVAWTKIEHNNRILIATFTLNSNTLAKLNNWLKRLA